MKKIFFIIAFLLFIIKTNAQGQWISKTVATDELLGEKGGKTCIYHDPDMGTLVVWDWNDPQFRIISKEHIFNINSGGWIKTLIGIYDDRGNLTEKIELWLTSESSRDYTYARTISSGMIPPGQKKKVRKLFKALQNSSGYVRIVAQRYNDTSFDLKVIPYTGE